jgi:hypothetical protein
VAFHLQLGQDALVAFHLQLGQDALVAFHLQLGQDALVAFHLQLKSERVSLGLKQRKICIPPAACQPGHDDAVFVR